MCGISVVVDVERQRWRGGDDKVRCKMHEELSSSLDAIAHRGPDSRGIWISEDNYVGK